MLNRNECNSVSVPSGVHWSFIFCWNQLKCVTLASKENNRWWFQISQVRTAISWSNCNCFYSGVNTNMHGLFFVVMLHWCPVSFWHHQLKLHLLYRPIILSFCQGHLHKSQRSVSALAVRELSVLTLWEINIF